MSAPIADDVTTEAPAVRAKPPAGDGDLGKMRAYWVAERVVAWRVPAADADGRRRSFALHHSAAASLRLGANGSVEGADETLELSTSEGSELPTAVTRKFPHLRGCTALQLPEGVDARRLLRGQLAVSVASADGATINATGLQLPGVIDELCFHDGPLGARVSGEGTSMAVWAPTAQQVELLVYEGPRGGTAQTHEMQRSERGVWSFQTSDSWLWRYYKYRVTVYCPWTRRVEAVEVTDPYSVALAADGERTQIADLSNPHLVPAGWEGHRPPALASFLDISIYELHIRDFRHLREMREAGLTHVHLLPAYDFATVPERPEDQLDVEVDLSQFPGDSEAQQAQILRIADRDAFNWGYDPVHYMTPEGSYATDPDGAERTLELRQMVQALHAAGLRVVLDVVYNHTFHSGLSRYSVLDKVVPAYYHRLEDDGSICGSAFGANNAPEHAMMERLVIDDLLHWARTYRVDGFRFDIMSCLMVSTMEKARDALRGLTLERDGVDGSCLYLYGEGWDFGEVAFNQRGRNATQLNMAGTGIGTFNDRLRDAVMGGSPFAPSREQGFVAGLALRPNGYTAARQSEREQRELLLQLTDMLRVAMAGNLRSVQLQDRTGKTVRGSEVLYNNSQPAGYAAEPVETVNYAGCHDGEIIFDQLIMKPADQVTAEERARMATLAAAMVALSQGVAFFHAGDELLRSKSLDRDSYGSGDWFNRLDWSMATNNFPVGLPVSPKNADQWPEKRPFLARQELKPGSRLIATTKARFLELLRLRYSSPLFRLPSAAHIQKQLRHHNTGPDQALGVVAVELLSGEAGDSAATHDPAFSRVLVVINARPDAHSLPWPPGVDALELHPMQAASADEPTCQSAVDSGARTVTVPARTAAVFVTPRAGA